MITELRRKQINGGWRAPSVDSVFSADLLTAVFSYEFTTIIVLPGPQLRPLSFPIIPFRVLTLSSTTGLSCQVRLPWFNFVQWYHSVRLPGDW